MAFPFGQTEAFLQKKMMLGKNAAFVFTFWLRKRTSIYADFWGKGKLIALPLSRKLALSESVDSRDKFEPIALPFARKEATSKLDDFREKARLLPSFLVLKKHFQ